MKKISPISLIVSIIILLNVASLPVTAAGTQTSVDITRLPDLSDISGHWAENLIGRAVVMKFVNGYNDETFRPDNTVTRSEYIKMVITAFDITADGIHTFEDVSGHWCEQYASIAYSAGLIYGVGNSKFEPDREMTRREALLTLSRVEAYLGTFLSESGEYIPYVDEDYIGEAYLDAVRHATLAGIITGRPGNIFDPVSPTTRAEAVKMILLTLDGLNSL